MPKEPRHYPNPSNLPEELVRQYEELEELDEKIKELEDSIINFQAPTDPVEKKLLEELRILEQKKAKLQQLVPGWTKNPDWIRHLENKKTALEAAIKALSATSGDDVTRMVASLKESLAKVDKVLSEPKKELHGLSQSGYAQAVHRVLTTTQEQRDAEDAKGAMYALEPEDLKFLDKMQLDEQFRERSKSLIEKDICDANGFIDGVDGKRYKRPSLDQIKARLTPEKVRLLKSLKNPTLFLVPAIPLSEINRNGEYYSLANQVFEDDDIDRGMSQQRGLIIRDAYKLENMPRYNPDMPEVGKNTQQKLEDNSLSFPGWDVVIMDGAPTTASGFTLEGVYSTGGFHMYRDKDDVLKTLRRRGYDIAGINEEYMLNLLGLEQGVPYEKQLSENELKQILLLDAYDPLKEQQLCGFYNSHLRRFICTTPQEHFRNLDEKALNNCPIAMRRLVRL